MPEGFPANERRGQRRWERNSLRIPRRVLDRMRAAGVTKYPDWYAGPHDDWPVTPPELVRAIRRLGAPDA